MRKRKTVLIYPPKLNYSDTGELVKLLSTLGNLECTKLHIKINEYLWRTTKAIPFIIEHVGIPSRLKIRAIGRVELPTPVELKDNCLFMQHVNETKKVEKIKKSDLEGVLVCILEKILIEEYRAEYKNCFLCPIEHPINRKTIPYFVALVNAKDFFDCERIYNGIVTECMRHAFGMIRSASNYEEEKRHHEKIKTLLTAFVQITSSMGTDMIYHEIETQSAEALGASSCSVFINNSHEELVLKSSNADYTNDKGNITNLTNFAFENIQSYLCKKPIEDPLYGVCDMKAVPRNLLAFPICSNDEALGVVEVYDKRMPHMNFDGEDDEMAMSLGRVIGLAIDTHNKYDSFLSAKLKMSYADCIFLRRTKMIDDYHAVLSVLKCRNEHKYHRFSDIRFDVGIVPEDHVICVCLRIFEGLGLIKMFHVNKEKCIRFLLKVRHGYSALPLHGWPHAFATMHFTFVCINNLKLIQNGYITGMEAFAMLIASLCHSIDSRGSTNMFQMTSGAVLACLFSSPGSLAQLLTICLLRAVKRQQVTKTNCTGGLIKVIHSASQTLRLMNYQECNFLEGLADEQNLAFSVLIYQMIKDMNVAYNRANLKALDTLVCNEYDFNNIRHRRLIHNLILNCAQMNFVCKEWLYCRKVGEQCFEEFFRKGDLSHASGVFEMSDLNEDILKLPEMNTNFIEVISLPTYRTFINIFPFMSVCVNKIMKNLTLWKVEKEKILANMVKDALGDTAEGEDD